MVQCPHCADNRASSGETYGSRKVWLSDGIPSPQTKVTSVLSEPSVASQNVSPVLLRCMCFHPPCVYGTLYIYRPIMGEQYVIRRRKCPRCQGRGFQVMRLGQSAMIPVRETKVAWEDLPKET